MITSESAAREAVLALADGDEAVLVRLDRFAEMLTEESSRQNLVSAASLTEVWQRHIADSAQLLAHVPRGTLSPWLDLGTGAGFPGVVIAAIQPEREVVMVESRARRISWLESVCMALDLPNARVIGKRLELVDARPMGVISARAFAPLDKLLALSARFSTPATIWLLPKGRSAQQELEALTGWNHRFHVEQSQTDAEAGVIVGQLEGGLESRKGRKPS